MTTKTKTPTTLSAAAQSRQVLDTAEADNTRLTAREDQATTAVDDLAARLDQGDQTVTAGEWLAAHAEQEITARLAAWAASKVKNARERLINDDTRLADLFAPHLAEQFDGKVKIMTTGNPAEVASNDDGTPVLWAVQSKPTTVTGGILSGLLDLVYLRPSLFAPLDGGRVEQLARQAGYAVRGPLSASSRRTGDQHRDDLRVPVVAAAPTVPVLNQAPTQEDAREVGRVVSLALFDAVRGPNNRPNPLGTNRAASSELVSAPIVSTKGDQTRVVTIETTHKLITSDAVRVDDAHRRIREVTIADLVGTVVPGAGRITATDTPVIQLPSDDPARSSQPWTVKVRLTLTYQL